MLDIIPKFRTGAGIFPGGVFFPRTNCGEFFRRDFSYTKNLLIKEHYRSKFDAGDFTQLWKGFCQRNFSLL